jgi:hypothetical protein
MPATAAATASTAKQPNFFDLSGGAIKVSYSSTSFGVAGRCFITKTEK